MIKKIFLRAVSGFPLGLAIGYTISIITSLIWANGYYSPCMPELVLMMGSEINAVLLQALLCGLLGAGCAAGSVIWEVETWGVAKQTGIYFLIISVIMMPIAYITHWMEHSLKGILSYFGIFTFLFALVWLILYTRAKHNIKKINKTLQQQRNSGIV